MRQSAKLLQESRRNHQGEGVSLEAARTFSHFHKVCEKEALTNCCKENATRRSRLQPKRGRYQRQPTLQGDAIDSYGSDTNILQAKFPRLKRPIGFWRQSEDVAGHPPDETVHRRYFVILSEAFTPHSLEVNRGRFEVDGDASPNIQYMGLRIMVQQKVDILCLSVVHAQQKE